MASIATAPAFTDSVERMSDQHLDSLASTYDHAAVPVWIYDMLDRCIYANRAANRRAAAEPDTSFDIINGQGRRVGRLATLEG